MPILTRSAGRHLRWLLLILSFILLPLQLMALEPPQLTGRINDYANILSLAVESQLETTLAAFEAEESTQLVVVTMDSLRGDVLEDFSLRLAEKWKIGQKQLDNGAILLIAKKERKLRIEVGYGLEGTLTDLQSGRIISRVIVPQFKKGNYEAGIIAGVSAMMDTVRGEFAADGPGRITFYADDDPAGFLFMLLATLFVTGKALGRNKWLAAAAGGGIASLLGLVVLGPRWPIIAALFPIGVVGGLIATFFVSTRRGPGRPGRRTDRWGLGGGFPGSGGGFGGGFGGGGGGFGGGGASGGW